MSDRHRPSGDVAAPSESRDQLGVVARERNRPTHEAEALGDREKRLADSVTTLREQVEDLTSALGQRDRELGLLAGRLRTERERSLRLGSAVEGPDLTELQARLDRVTTELRSLTSSRVWSLAQLIWRARMFVAPVGSQRERLLGLHASSKVPNSHGSK